MKILAFTDAHLGGGSGYSNDRLADQEGTLDQIVGVAAEREVDGVLFAGDMYDTPRPTVAAQHVLHRFRVGLEQIGVPFLGINGNAGHDLDGFGRPSALELEASHWFRVSRTPEMIRWTSDVAVCTLPSIPVTKLVADHDGGDRGEINALAALLLAETARDLRAQVPDGWPSILMGHWSMTGGALPSGLPVADLGEVILDHFLLDDLGFDVAFFGHIHKAQRMNEAGTLLYGGPPHVTRFDEAGDEHGCWIIDFEDGNTSIEFVPLLDRRFVTIDVDLTENETRNIHESIHGLDETGLSSEPTDAQSHDGTSRAPAGAAPRVPTDGSHLLDETDTIAAAIAEHLPLTDAVVKLRYRATEEQHRRVDLPALKRLIMDAGAHKIYSVTPEIIRGSRARVEGLDESFSPGDALGAWCTAQNVDGERASALNSLLAGYIADGIAA